MPSPSSLAARLGPAAAALLIAACASDDIAAPDAGGRLTRADINELAAEVRQLTAIRGITALERPPAVRTELVRLGKLLAFDKELSGNRDISCMTCHLPRFATGDTRSLSVGQGATALGPDRSHPASAFIPRNAPSLFNLHTLESFFWDGRVFRTSDGLVHTPAGDEITPAMAEVFEFGALSALPLFPVLSRSEMRADGGNELAAIADDDESLVWQALMARLGAIPEYRALFEVAYPGQRFGDMTFAHASNAIAGFLISEFSTGETAWDRFLGGDDFALTDLQLAGARNFMAARCSICHNGSAFTDNEFHNVALAQLGPGQGDGSGFDDFGRMRVTGDPADRYRFRTTPLRNVELTGPWGHDGAFTDLRQFIDHYSESHLKLFAYDAGQLEPLLRGSVLRHNLDDILATRDTLLNGVVFTPQQVDEVTEFMRALTDPRAHRLGVVTPERVPSGLAVDDSRRFALMKPGNR